MIHQPFDQLIESLAAKTPTPGGGAAAAMAGCMGAALFLMVVRFSRGKKANVDREVRATLVRFLRQWTKVAVSNPIAMMAGDIVRNHGLEVPDALIAATALHTHSQLVTKNTKDFRRVRGLRVQVPY